MNVCTPHPYPRGARDYAHQRIEQNLLGLVVLVVVEVVLLPTFADDAARIAAAETVRSAQHAAEVVYDATVGTDCVKCRQRAAADAQGALDDVKERLKTQNTLLVQAAVEPHLWSAKFPLAPYQTLALDLENVRRILGLMRAALSAMSYSPAPTQDNNNNGRLGGGGGGGGFGGGGGSDATNDEGASDDPRAQVRALLFPTDEFVTELRRAVKTRLSRAAEDLGTGAGRWETRAASASIARAQASLERAFILHTLEIRKRFQSGESSMFLPNHLMVPWHAYILCTHVLAGHVDSLGAASMEALLAVKPHLKSSDDAEEDARGRGGGGGGGGAGDGAAGTGKTSTAGGGGGGGGGEFGGGGGENGTLDDFCGVCVEEVGSAATVEKETETTTMAATAAAPAGGVIARAGSLRATATAAAAASRTAAASSSSAAAAAAAAAVAPAAAAAAAVDVPPVSEEAVETVEMGTPSKQPLLGAQQRRV